MKKSIFVSAFIMFVCCTSLSCQEGGVTIQEVDDAKKEAVSAAKKEIKEELEQAESQLDSCKLKALEAINDKQKALNSKMRDDLVAYTNKVDSITITVQQMCGKMNEEMKHRVDEFAAEIDNIYSNININRGIASVSMVCVLLLLLYVVWRMRQNDKRTDNIIDNYNQHYNLKGGGDVHVAGKPSQNTVQAFNNQIAAWLKNQRNQEAIIEIVNKSRLNEVNKATNVGNQTNNPTNTTYNTNNATTYQTVSSIPTQSPVEGDLVLYARERLNNISSSYVPGKSIYKLILASKNSVTASVVLCAEESNRIIEISDYLDDCCVFDKLSSAPSTVTVLKPGKAELKNGQWCLIDRVKVELR